MKRIQAILVVLAAATLLAACGGQKKEEVTSALVEMRTTAAAAEETTSLEAASETTETAAEEVVTEVTAAQEAEAKTEAETRAAKAAGPLVSYTVTYQGKKVETVHYLYDEQGNKTGAEIAKKPGDKPYAEMAYLYDENGRLTDAYSTAENGEYIRYSYDEKDRVIKEEVYFVENKMQPGQLKETRSYEYDEGDDPVMLLCRDKDGKETTYAYEYDARGEIASATALGATQTGLVETYTYNRGDKGELFSIVVHAEDPSQNIDVEWTELKNEIDYSGRVSTSYTYTHPTEADLEDFIGDYEDKGIENYLTKTEYYYDAETPEV